MQAPLQSKNTPDAVQTKTGRTARQDWRFADNRPEAVAQRQLAEMMNNSPGVLQQRALSEAIHNSPRMVAQHEEKTNPAGLPNPLKSGLDSLSGMSMDHVKVHHNSDEPAPLQAHAYTQGKEIHLGAGQERPLPHEAGHIAGNPVAAERVAGAVTQRITVFGLAEANEPRGMAATSSTAMAPLATSTPVVQREIRVDAENEGARYESGMDIVESDWNFSPAEKGIFQRWLTDLEPHRYADRAALKAAIHRVAIQPFGTDIAVSFVDADEQKAVFRQALEAGYRVFDTASTYGTLESLWAAVDELAIPRSELTIIFKTQPAHDAKLAIEISGLPQGEVPMYLQGRAKELEASKVGTKLAKAKTALGGELPDVLMLHDVDTDEATLHETIKLFASHIVAGRAKALGVSNVSLPELQMLVPLAVEAGAPIRYVQNRFSPYFRDDKVREYCKEENIQYMSYGLMGSAQVGACAGVGGEGTGIPTQYLLARHDPRLRALAAASGINEGELLLAWAQARGIVPVTFTSRGDQARQNFNRAALPLSAGLITQLDNLFVAPSADAKLTVDSMVESSAPLKSLYAAFPDPTAWSIIDALRGAEGGQGLMMRVAADIVAAHPEAVQQSEALKRFSLNLIRHVADIQSTIQRMQNDRNAVIKSNLTAEVQEIVPEVTLGNWTELLIPAFQELAAAADAPHVFALFFKWAQENHDVKGHTMLAAAGLWGEMTRTPAPEHDNVEIPVMPETPVASTPVSVSYDDARLKSYSSEDFKAEEREALEPDEFLNLDGVLYLVVKNNKNVRTLEIAEYVQ